MWYLYDYLFNRHREILFRIQNDLQETQRKALNKFLCQLIYMNALQPAAFKELLIVVMNPGIHCFFGKENDGPPIVRGPMLPKIHKYLSKETRVKISISLELRFDKIDKVYICCRRK